MTETLSTDACHKQVWHAGLPPNPFPKLRVAFPETKEEKIRNEELQRLTELPTNTYKTSHDAWISGEFQGKDSVA